MCILQISVAVNLNNAVIHLFPYTLLYSYNIKQCEFWANLIWHRKIHIAGTRTQRHFTFQIAEIYVKIFLLILYCQIPNPSRRTIKGRLTIHHLQAFLLISLSSCFYTASACSLQFSTNRFSTASKCLKSTFCKKSSTRKRFVLFPFT